MENIFYCIQLSGMSYSDIMKMPVDVLYKYIDWKIKWDKDIAEAKRKAYDEMNAKIRSRSRRR